MEPFDSFAERIVRNKEYQTLIDHLIKHGGDKALIEMIAAINKHRYVPIKED